MLEDNVLAVKCSLIFGFLAFVLSFSCVVAKVVATFVSFENFKDVSNVYWNVNIFVANFDNFAVLDFVVSVFVLNVKVNKLY